jgi:Tfp pilus assembly protein FimT
MTDFEDGPLNDFGVTAVRTPVTVTTDFHGNKTYTDGTNANITVVFSPVNKEYTLDEAGLTRVYDARVFLKDTETLNKYDKITYDSKVYRVDRVSERDFDGTGAFRVAMLFFIKDE